ncbi:uncharacterized protein [Nicotiana sylvestris]|uniref:uncharacterized protein n=1 Tax=Nicotiana sylvestris TaxID=4096 RepID=UPI00388C8E52
MDVNGPIKPAASNVHSFILAAIDFTKWVEAVTFKSVTKKANGAVEAANKNIKKILRKMVQGSRQWHEKFPFALLGYRTTVRSLVGATPYLLVYGTEAVIPTEVEIPSLRIVAEAKIDDDEWVKTRLEELSLIDEKRLAAVCHGQLYQKRMTKAYNKKGPFVVTTVFPNSALYLIDIEGKCVDKTINSDAVEGKENLLIHRDSPMKKAWFGGKKFCSESSKKRAWFRTLLDNGI